jgi:tetratricopeptide (TPR) repeat protein
MRYSAFISYNHRDRVWAIWLHRALERYSVPARLIGREAPWGKIGQRLPPVFRDRDELATSSDLAASVKAALAESATLVVICSPNSAKSQWVDEEIKTFIAAGREKFIRLIIIDGEPHSSDPARECLPPSLMRDGAPEPLAADARKEGDGREAAKLKLLAGILDVPYDELRQREAARRHKRLVAIALAASVGFFVMAGLTIFALISRADAIQQRQLAERRTITAERTVDFVKGMFKLADPEQASGASITAREIVDRGAAKLDSPDLSREPMVKAELGVTLAEVYGALGLYRKSDALIRRTFSIHHGETATFARQLNALGQSQLRLADYETAERTFRRALTLTGTASASVRSEILVGLGSSLSNLEKYAEADGVLRQALKGDRARGDPVYVAYDLEALGQNHFYEGKLEQAQPLIQEALVLRQRSEGPLSPGVGDNFNMLGQIAYMQHDLPAAERYFRGNLAVDQKVLGPDHPDAGTTMNNLARVLLEQRRFDDAGPLLQQAIAIGKQERGDANAYMAFAYSNLAIVRSHTSKLAEAEALFGQAIAVARAIKHRSLGPSLADLAQVMCATRRTAEGLKLLDEALAATRADYPDDPWRSAWVKNVRGECLIRAGQKQQGRTAIAASSPIIIKSWPPGSLFAVEAQRRAKLAI